MTSTQREKVKKKVAEAHRKQKKAAKKDVTWKSKRAFASAICRICIAYWMRLTLCIQGKSKIWASQASSRSKIRSSLKSHRRKIKYVDIHRGPANTVSLTSLAAARARETASERAAEGSASSCFTGSSESCASK